MESIYHHILGVPAPSSSTVKQEVKEMEQHIITGTYLANNGVRHSCQLNYSKHTNKYYWSIFGHNDHYETIEEAIASLPSFIKTV